MREVWKRKHERDPGETTVHVDYFTADNFHITVLKNKDAIKDLIPRILSTIESGRLKTLDDSLELGTRMI